MLVLLGNECLGLCYAGELGTRPLFKITAFPVSVQSYSSVDCYTTHTIAFL
jgi:hypothetical protein